LKVGERPSRKTMKGKSQKGTNGSVTRDDHFRNIIKRRAKDQVKTWRKIED